MNPTTEINLSQILELRVELWHGEASRLHDEWKEERGRFQFGGQFALRHATRYSGVELQRLEVKGTPMAIAEMLWRTHNSPNRPRGQEIRSMSVGDVLVLTFEYGDGAVETIVLRAANFGFEQVTPENWLAASKITEGQMERRMDLLVERLEEDPSSYDGGIGSEYTLPTMSR